MPIPTGLNYHHIFDERGEAISCYRIGHHYFPWGQHFCWFGTYPPSPIYTFDSQVFADFVHTHIHSCIHYNFDVRERHDIPAIQPWSILIWYQTWSNIPSSVHEPFIVLMISNCDLQGGNSHGEDSRFTSWANWTKTLRLAGPSAIDIKHLIPQYPMPHRPYYCAFIAARHVADATMASGGLEVGRAGAFL